MNGTAVTATAGHRLLDVLDDLPAELLPVSCRSAHCGRCAVAVLSGAAGLRPPTEHELQSLADFGLGSGHRLGCQIVLSEASQPIVMRTLACDMDAAGH